MKGIYLIQYYPPERSSGMELVQDLLAGFSARGWDTALFTPTPTRGVTAEQRAAYAKKRVERQFEGRVTVRRMRLYREGRGTLARALRYVLFSLQCLWKCLTVPADFIFTGSGPPTQGVVAGLAAMLTKKAVVYNLQDMFPDSLVTAGICGENALPVRLGRRLERFTYRRVGKIITISEDMQRSLLRKGVDPGKLLMVRNWVDGKRMRPVPRAENALFDELGISRDAFLVTYAGNLGKAQSVDTLVDAAALLQDAPVHFVLFGGGSEEEAVREKIAALGLENVQLFPFQPMERVPEVYSLGDVSCVLTRRGVAAAGMPSKTASILACGAPVLAAFDENSELADVLRENACGVCVPPEDPAALAEAIRALANDPDRVRRMGKNARAFAETHLAKDRAVTAYAELIETAVAERKHAK